MEKTLEEKVKDAKKIYMNFWLNVAKVTADPQDMRLLIDCRENYETLLKEYDKQINQEKNEIEIASQDLEEERDIY